MSAIACSVVLTTTLTWSLRRAMPWSWRADSPRSRARLSPPVISAERIADELRRMLESPRPKLALELLDEAGLLEVVLPEIAACKGVAQSGYHTHDVYGHTLEAVEHTGPDLLLRLAAL